MCRVCVSNVRPTLDSAASLSSTSRTEAVLNLCGNIVTHHTLLMEWCSKTSPLTSWSCSLQLVTSAVDSSRKLSNYLSAFDWCPYSLLHYSVISMIRTDMIGSDDQLFKNISAMGAVWITGIIRIQLELDALSTKKHHVDSTVVNVPHFIYVSVYYYGFKISR